MKSALVLGDVRSHTVDLAPDINKTDTRKPYILYGGAFFMRNAIWQALNSLKAERPEVIFPEIFSYPIPEEGTLFGGGRKWILDNIGAMPNSGFRLKDGGPLPRTKMPSIDLLRSALQKGGTFLSAPDIEQWNRKLAPNTLEESELVLPDILVFDDLGERLRFIEINDDAPDHDNNPVDLASVINVLFSRLRKMPRIPKSMSPIMVISVMDDLDGLLRQHQIAPGKNRFWSKILKEPGFCTRTILLLDAEDIRRVSGAGLSTGLSWERTVQDTISEFRRSDLLRPLLQCSNIIVRFGVTGALHISRKRSTHSSDTFAYTLHFRPEEDDSLWVDQKKYGHLLGYSSIFVASLVRSLTDTCDSENATAHVHHLGESIASSVYQAVKLCREMGAKGYGANLGEFAAIAANNWLHRDTFARMRADDERVKLVPIAVTQVPHVTLRNWSLLVQSTQTRVAEVARHIVTNGVDAVLNQPTPNKEIIFDSLTSALVMHAMSVRESLMKGAQDAGQQDIRDKLTDEVVRNSIIDAARFTVFEQYEVVGTRTLDSLVTLLPERGMEDWEEIVNLICGDSDFTKATVPAENAKKGLEEKLSGASKDFIVIPKIYVDPHGDVVAPFVRLHAKNQNPMIVVDRREIESFRAIHRLISSHIDLVARRKVARPLSLAVFGPPGSGKSTAVKRIIQSLDPRFTEKHFVQCNLAQFTDVKQLDDVIGRVARVASDVEAENIVPIAFFDEFDCRFQDSPDPWGWLKFFLAPMEDGMYGEQAVKTAILVFAGGISSSFSEFSLEHRAPTDPQYVAFSKAKGPDFVSRLRGHLNILGINPVDADDDLYLIRRAVLIRSILANMQNLSEGDAANIDPGMVKGVLHVPNYLHGGRSARMLLELCRSHTGRITMSAVPPIHQLNMQVDGKAFLDLMANT